LLPVMFVWNTIDLNLRTINRYIVLDNLERIMDRSESYEYSELWMFYGNFSDEKIFWKQNNLIILQWTFLLFHFVFVYGIFEMVYVSFYKRELIK
jgi:hypothetical protein